MTDIRSKLPTWLTPQICVSFANFLTLVFFAGAVYSTLQGELARNKQDISDMKADIRSLRQNETSIAILNTDLKSIKDTVVRIEGRIDRMKTLP